MLPTDDRWKPKHKIQVAVRTNDGEILEGYVFIPPDMRVLDLMNGFNPYIPFENRNGIVEIINKSSIARLRPFDQANTRARHPGQHAPGRPLQPTH